MLKVSLIKLLLFFELGITLMHLYLIILIVLVLISWTGWILVVRRDHLLPLYLFVFCGPFSVGELRAHPHAYIELEWNCLWWISSFAMCHCLDRI